MKYHIDRNTVQETLVIPLYARKICMDKYPDLFTDKKCQELIEKIDYDFEKNGKKVPLFGALEGGTRQYDLCYEVRNYLEYHPKACVVNLGCGLDTTFFQIDNGEAKGYNLDMPDVIKVRNELLPESDRELNIACDLNNTEWFNKIDFNSDDGAVFIAGGVFYYFTNKQIKTLLCNMSKHFKGGTIAFDVTTPFGLKMMLKTWVKGADIKDIGAYFCLKDTEGELSSWTSDFKKVTQKKYMTGYRKPDKRWGKLNCWLSYFADKSKLCQIAVVDFN